MVLKAAMVLMVIVVVVMVMAVVINYHCQSPLISLLRPAMVSVNLLLSVVVVVAVIGICRDNNNDYHNPLSAIDVH